MLRLNAPPLPIIDGLRLNAARRAVLRPGEVVECADGVRRALPRYFFRIDSHEQARAVFLAPEFRASEFIAVDVREAELLRTFPRFLPCAAAHLAAHLATLRTRWGSYVHIATNGGYRSPAHAASGGLSAHAWGTAANIYRVGDDRITGRNLVVRYRREVAETLPALWTRPFGYTKGKTTDHLHLDLGYLAVTPRDVAAVEPSEDDGAER